MASEFRASSLWEAEFPHSDHHLWTCARGYLTLCQLTSLAEEWGACEHGPEGPVPDGRGWSADI